MTAGGARPRRPEREAHRQSVVREATTAGGAHPRRLERGFPPQRHVRGATTAGGARPRRLEREAHRQSVVRGATTAGGAHPRRPFRAGIAGAGLAALALTPVFAGVPSAAFAETRGYVISMVHTATWGDTDTCPRGDNGGLADLKTRRLVRRGFSEDEARAILARGGVDRDGNRVQLVELPRLNGVEVNPGNVPVLVPDPRIRTAQGRFAYGFNLNGRVEPDSFEDPDSGERGVDNRMWRALGCFEVYRIRRPVRPYNEDIAWDTALDSMPAWLLSVSGPDLDRDGEVTVTFDRALNVAMRDARGGVLSGATYVVDPDPRSHSVFAGRIENRILTVAPGDFSMQGESQFYAILRFSGTRLRLELADDGSVAGIIGGYQPWRDYFRYLAIRGEENAQVDLPGVYYALKRLADGPPDPETGERTAISAAYRLEAVPAFHATLAGEVVADAVGPGPALSGPAVRENVTLDPE